MGSSPSKHQPVPIAQVSASPASAKYASNLQPQSGSTPPPSNQGKTRPPPYDVVASYKHRECFDMKPALARTAAEDVLLALQRFDTVLLVDDSSSMTGARWRQAGISLIRLATVAARYDHDGIDIQFLNSKRRASGIKDAEEVQTLFASVSPRGRTPLGARLDEILTEYCNKLKRDSQTKALNLIVITDGEPTDGPETENVILRTASVLDGLHARTAQLGIQFVQIGDDVRARAYLQMLDDGLAQYGVRDIVDTTLSGDGDGLDMDLVKILVGAVNRRVDNRGSQVLTGKLLF
ncbi:hypothetical protein H0H81_009861 [Sphagnurus paluster]|uniref:VWFA domain-containing protein n=1 Tax=Sphagnurus paluster TaxID=117069 RepID=A0A9P7FTB6_9AGAR|nr:hypothetical protein H0H81_009861 [Sphagnurus paluster]